MWTFSPQHVTSACYISPYQCAPISEGWQQTIIVQCRNSGTFCVRFVRDFTISEWVENPLVFGGDQRCISVTWPDQSHPHSVRFFRTYLSWFRYQPHTSLVSCSLSLWKSVAQCATRSHWWIISEKSWYMSKVPCSSGISEPLRSCFICLY